MATDICRQKRPEADTSMGGSGDSGDAHIWRGGRGYGWEMAERYGFAAFALDRCMTRAIEL